MKGWDDLHFNELGLLLATQARTHGPANVWGFPMQIYDTKSRIN